MRRVSCAVLFFSCILVCFAESNGILVPREVFVGDSAEFSFETGVFSSDSESNTTISVPPDEIPLSSDATINSITVTRKPDSATVTIRFVPWVSGVIKLPSFSVASRIVTPPPVRIASIIEKTGKNSLEPPRSPLLIPGTTWLLYGIIAGISVIVFLFIFTAIRIHRYVIANPSKRNAGKRKARIMKELKILERRLKRKDVSDWYAAYTRVLRRYLGSLCFGNTEALLSATGAEILAEINAQLVSAAVSSQEITSLLTDFAAFFAHVNTVRFSGYPYTDIRLQDIKTARTLVSRVESCIAETTSSESPGKFKNEGGYEC